MVSVNTVIYKRFRKPGAEAQTKIFNKISNRRVLLAHLCLRNQEAGSDATS
jgi:hypothetical protein